MHKLFFFHHKERQNQKENMKTLKNTINPQKRNYVKPQIDRIILDNDISMVMQSTPPLDPDEMIQPEHFSINPFKLPNL